jgi:hypothetical protein
MSKLVRLFAIAALIAGALAMTPGPAAAQHHHGGHGGGHWHGGGWRGGGGWGGGWGWGWGPGPVFGWGGFPYPYYGGYYDGGPDCAWVNARVLRRGHWVPRQVWRCW